jgi:hypothetical protein
MKEAAVSPSRDGTQRVWTMGDRVAADSGVEGSGVVAVGALDGAGVRLVDVLSVGRAR